jgi:hypothetical protein
MDTNLSSNASVFREPKAAESTLVAFGITHTDKATSGSFSLREVVDFPDSGAHYCTAEVEQLHDRHSACRRSSVHSLKLRAQELERVMSGRTCGNWASPMCRPLRNIC